MDIHMITGPLIGAAIGYFTNYIAVKMLFHPRHEIKLFGHTLPFTPGAIPKEKHRIARAAGSIISNHLITTQDLEERLFKPNIENQIIAYIMNGCKKNIQADLMVFMQQEDKYEKAVSLMKQRLMDELIQSVNHLDIEHIISVECAKVVDEKAGNSMVVRLMGNGLIAALSGSLAEEASRFINEDGKEMIASIFDEKWTKLEQESLLEVANESGIEQKSIEEQIRNVYHELVYKAVPAALTTLDIAGVVEEKINAMNNKELEDLVLEAMAKELKTIVNLGALIGLVLGMLNIII